MIRQKSTVPLIHLWWQNIQEASANGSFIYVCGDVCNEAWDKIDKGTCVTLSSKWRINGYRNDGKMIIALERYCHPSAAKSGKGNSKAIDRFKTICTLLRILLQMSVELRLDPATNWDEYIDLQMSATHVETKICEEKAKSTLSVTNNRWPNNLNAMHCVPWDENRVQTLGKFVKLFGRVQTLKLCENGCVLPRISSLSYHDYIIEIMSKWSINKKQLFTLLNSVFSSYCEKENYQEIVKEVQKKWDLSPSQLVTLISGAFSSHCTNPIYQEIVKEVQKKWDLSPSQLVTLLSGAFSSHCTNPIYQEIVKEVQKKWDLSGQQLVTLLGSPFSTNCQKENYMIFATEAKENLQMSTCQFLTFLGTGCFEVYCTDTFRFLECYHLAKKQLGLKHDDMIQMLCCEGFFKRFTTDANFTNLLVEWNEYLNQPIHEFLKLLGTSKFVKSIHHKEFKEKTSNIQESLGMCLYDVGIFLSEWSKRWENPKYTEVILQFQKEYQVSGSAMAKLMSSSAFSYRCLKPTFIYEIVPKFQLDMGCSSKNLVKMLGASSLCVQLEKNECFSTRLQNVGKILELSGDGLAEFLDNGTSSISKIIGDNVDFSRVLDYIKPKFVFVVDLVIALRNSCFLHKICDELFQSVLIEAKEELPYDVFMGLMAESSFPTVLSEHWGTFRKLSDTKQRELVELLKKKKSSNLLYYSQKNKHQEMREVVSEFC